MRCTVRAPVHQATCQQHRPQDNATHCFNGGVKQGQAGTVSLTGFLGPLDRPPAAPSTITPFPGKRPPPAAPCPRVWPGPLPSVPLPVGLPWLEGCSARSALHAGNIT